MHLYNKLYRGVQATVQKPLMLAILLLLLFNIAYCNAILLYYYYLIYCNCCIALLFNAIPIGQNSPIGMHCCFQPALIFYFFEEQNCIQCE